MELFDKRRIRNGKNLIKKTRGAKSRVFGKMEKLRHFRSNMGTEGLFDERSNGFQTIPKNDIRGKILRFQF